MAGRLLLALAVVACTSAASRSRAGTYLVALTLADDVDAGAVAAVEATLTLPGGFPATMDQRKGDRWTLARTDAGALRVTFAGTGEREYAIGFEFANEQRHRIHLEATALDAGRRGLAHGDADFVVDPGSTGRVDVTLVCFETGCAAVPVDGGEGGTESESESEAESEAEGEPGLIGEIAPHAGTARGDGFRLRGGMALPAGGPPARGGRFTLRGELTITR